MPRNIRIMPSGRYQVELRRRPQRFSLGVFDTLAAVIAVRDAYVENEQKKASK